MKLTCHSGAAFGPGIAVRIERIDAIVFGDDKHHVVDTLPRNVQSPHVQWLAVNLAVDRDAKEGAELTRQETRRRQNGLV